VFGSFLLGGAALLVIKGPTLMGAIGAEVAAAAAAALAGFMLARKFRTCETLHLDFRQLLKKSAIFNIYAFAGNLYDRLDVVLLSKLAGDFATGIYSAAYRPLSMVQLIPYGVSYSLLPALARPGSSADETRRLERAMGFLLSAALAMVLATLVYAGPA